ncbi:MAG: AmmeMemoRadiSam system protein B [Candidatus Coatesbacteria bacterium]|nr:MAG: AmmeMemoRadiSam system protein B [Candidatus Coatesbacteria bacterium]
MATPNLRLPVVAGQFYPGSEAALRAELASYVVAAERKRYLGGLCPHAGYVYSGATAGELFGRLALPATVVLLGPKHHGAGADFAVWPAGAWQTPLGEAPVNEEVAAAIIAGVGSAQADERAHLPEHSLEVVVPFVQYVNPQAAIVPIAVGPAAPQALFAAGEALAEALAPYRDDVVLVISSDMTHYESVAAAERKDRLAIERLEALDAEGLLEVVASHNVSMCGAWPAAAALVALRGLGASGGSLVRYATSGEASGDYDQVVGYAAVTFA